MRWSGTWECWDVILKANRPHPHDYSTHRQIPSTVNDSSLLFVALGKAEPLISSSAHQKVTVQPWERTLTDRQTDGRYQVSSYIGGFRCKFWGAFEEQIHRNWWHHHFMKWWHHHIAPLLLLIKYIQKPLYNYSSTLSPCFAKATRSITIEYHLITTFQKAVNIRWDEVMYQSTTMQDNQHKPSYLWEYPQIDRRMPPSAYYIPALLQECSR